MCTCTHTFTYTQMHAHTHVYTQTHTHTCKHTNAWMHECMNTYIPTSLTKTILRNQSRASHVPVTGHAWFNNQYAICTFPFAYIYIITNVCYATYHIYYTGLSPSFIQELLPLEILTSGWLHDWWSLSPSLLCSIFHLSCSCAMLKKFSYHAQYYAHDYCKYVTVCIWFYYF